MGSSTVRMVAYKDLEKIESLCKEMYRDSLEEYNLTYNPEAMKQMIPVCFNSTFVLVDDEDNAQGVFIIQLTQGIGNNEILANELLWYVTKEYRGNGKSLLTFAEKWCSVNNVTLLILTHMGNFNERLGKIYQRMGYKPMQASYAKHFT